MSRDELPEISVSWSATDSDSMPVADWAQAWDATAGAIGRETARLIRILPRGWTLTVEIEK